METKTKFLLIGIVLGLSLLGTIIYFGLQRPNESIKFIESTSVNERGETAYALTKLKNNERELGYEIYITGNESIFFKNPRYTTHNKDTINITFDLATLEERKILVCSPTNRNLCVNVTFQLPNSIPERLQNGTTLRSLTINTSARTFTYQLDTKRNYIKLGTNSILILASNTYNATVTNATLENEFIHLATNDTALLTYLTFDENTTTIRDYSKYNHDYTITGTIRNYTDCKFGSCIQVDETNYASATEYTIGNATRGFTILAWVKPVNRVSYSFFMQASSTWVERVGVNPSLQLVMGGCDNTNTLEGGSLLVNDEWRHVAFRCNATSTTITQTSFINGSQNQVITNTGGGINNFRNSYIGYGAFSEFFEGKVDHLMIYNRSLSNSEINAIYQNQSSIFYPEGIANFSSKNLSDGSGTENRVNVSLQNMRDIFNSTINVSADGGTTWKTINGTTFNVTNLTLTSPSSATILFKLIAGNSSSNPWYSPTIIGNITLSSYTESTGGGGGSNITCTYSSGNWEAPCNCTISSNVDLLRNNLSISGYGNFTLTANITNFTKVTLAGANSSAICRVIVSNNGGFKR